MVDDYIYFNSQIKACKKFRQEVMPLVLDTKGEEKVFEDLLGSVDLNHISRVKCGYLNASVKYKKV